MRLQQNITVNHDVTYEYCVYVCKGIRYIDIDLHTFTGFVILRHTISSWTQAKNTAHR